MHWPKLTTIGGFLLALGLALHQSGFDVLKIKGVSVTAILSALGALLTGSAATTKASIANSKKGYF